ncbi:MAG: molybdopterin dinucleotide binding domain-containing protein, partial [Eubacteriales bacterium]
AHPNLVWKAMLTGKPYPVRSLIVMATNPMLTQADTSLIYEALKSLDLLVVLELFQTPTSMLADYVLPSAGAMESPEFETKAGTSNLAYGGEQAVNPYYERKPDYYFWRELGLRLGQEKDWPWKTFHESLEECLKPTGITWEEFCSTGLYCPPNLYQKYEQVDENTGKLAGFATTSGKIELYSEILDELGYEPLPVPKELSKKNNMYPLKLITGARYQPYYAASYHHFAKLRSIHPKPLAEMCPDTAIKLGLEDSCPVWVETERGRARFNLKIVQMCKEVVSLEYGWWNPELEAKEPCLGGVWDSNANMLTSGDFETSDPLIGTWTYNGLRCRVERA